MLDPMRSNEASADHEIVFHLSNCQVTNSVLTTTRWADARPARVYYPPSTGVRGAPERIERRASASGNTVDEADTAPSTAV